MQRVHNCNWRRFSGRADRSSSPITDAKLSENSTSAAEATASRIPMRSRSFRLQRTTASCCTWFRSTGRNSASKKALHSYAILSAPTVSLVTPSGRDDATDATSAEVILHSETSSLAIPFRTRMQRPMARPPCSNFLRARSRCLQATHSPLPNCPIWYIVLTERDKQLLAELRRASAMALPRCIVSRYDTAWAESLEGAPSGHQSLTMLCRYRCRLLLAEVPKALTETAELGLRLRLWEAGQVSELVSKVLGQQRSGPLRRRKRVTQPQTDEQHRKRACALTARGSISKAMKGLVGGAAQGSADCRRSGTTTLIPRISGTATAECAAAACAAWERWLVQSSVERHEGTRPQQNRYRITAACQTGAHECSGPRW